MIDISKIEFFDALNATPAKNLVGAVNSYVRAEIEFFIHWEAVGITLTKSNTNRLTWSGGNFFEAGFTLGDTIEIASGGAINGNYTILEISAEKIAVSPNPGGADGDYATVEVHGTTPITSVNFKFGLPKNSEGDVFETKLDGVSEQRYIARGLGATVLTGVKLEPASGKLHWVTGYDYDQDATVIKGLGIGSTNISTGREQCFRIEQIFYINPGYLDSQSVDDQLKFELVDYFFDTECLKYVCYIEASKDGQIFDHNTDKGSLSEFLLDGNTGWFNENKNGGVRLYSPSTIIKDSVSLQTIPDISNTNPCTVDFILPSNPGAGYVFSGTSNAAIVGMQGVVKEDEYAELTTSYNNNTYFDRCIVRQSLADTNGDYITAGAMSVNGSGQLLLQVTITPQSWMVEGARYILWVEAQGSGFTDLKLTDKMTFLVRDSKIIHYVDLSGVVANVVRVNDHPYTNAGNGYSDYKGWVEDDILLHDAILIKKENGQGENVTLNKVSVDVEVLSQDAPYNSFILEEGFDILIGDDGQLNYQYPAGSEKNHYFLEIDTPNSTLTHDAYTLQFPIKARYEEWLTQANSLAGFPDNKKWSGYSQLYITVNAFVSIGDNDEVNRHRTELAILDYDDYIGDPVIGEIQTFNSLNVSLGGKLDPNGATTVKAIFTGLGLSQFVFAATDFWGVIRWDLIGEGTVETIEEISSLFGHKTGNKWLGTTASVVKTLLPDTVTVTAVLDTANLNQSKNNYKLSARIGKLELVLEPIEATGGIATANTLLITGFGMDLSYPDQKYGYGYQIQPVGSPPFPDNKTVCFSGYMVGDHPQPIAGGTNYPIEADGSTFNCEASNQSSLSASSAGGAPYDYYLTHRVRFLTDEFAVSDIIWLAEDFEPGNSRMSQQCFVGFTTDLNIQFDFKGPHPAAVAIYNSSNFSGGTIGAFEAFFDIIEARLWKGGTIQENPTYYEFAYEIAGGVEVLDLTGDVTNTGTTANVNYYQLLTSIPLNTLTTGVHWLEIKASSTTREYAKSVYIVKITLT